jgi:hypothetical protein
MTLQAVFLLHFVLRLGTCLWLVFDPLGHPRIKKVPSHFLILLIGNVKMEFNILSLHGSLEFLTVTAVGRLGTVDVPSAWVMEFVGQC